MLFRLLKEKGIEVINVIRDKNKVDKLKKELNTELVIYIENNDNFGKEIKEISEKFQATVCFECIGGKVTGTIFNNMPPKSTLIVYGTLSGKDIEGVNGVQVRWS